MYWSVSCWESYYMCSSGRKKEEGKGDEVEGQGGTEEEREGGQTTPTTTTPRPPSSPASSPLPPQRLLMTPPRQRMYHPTRQHLLQRMISRFLPEQVMLKPRGVDEGDRWARESPDSSVDGGGKVGRGAEATSSSGDASAAMETAASAPEEVRFCFFGVGVGVGESDRASDADGGRGRRRRGKGGVGEVGWVSEGVLRELGGVHVVDRDAVTGAVVLAGEELFAEGAFDCSRRREKVNLDVFSSKEGNTGTYTPERLDGS